MIKRLPSGLYSVRWKGTEATVRVDADGTATDLWIIDPTVEKLRRFPLGRVLDSIAARKTLGEHGGRYKLERPEGRKLHDAFYVNVARAYRDAVRSCKYPRKTLSADSGAADATVAGWIMEARKRGHLPPAQHGKVSP